MELRHLQYFLAVAEELHFGRAARKLNIAQPSLSQQIRQLERELGGTTLFDRTSRPITLTSAGRLLMADAVSLLADASTIARDVRRAGRGEGGRIRLGYSYGGMYDVVLRLLLRFRQAWPAATIMIHQLAERDQQAALRAHRVDIVLGRLTEPVTEGILVRPLREEKLIAILPTSHPLAGAEVVPLAELRDEHFVMFPRAIEPVVFDNYISACTAAGFHMKLDYEVTDAQTQALTIATGLGVGLSGDHLALRFPGLVYRPVNPDTTIAEIAALWLKVGAPDWLPAFLDELSSC